MSRKRIEEMTKEEMELEIQEYIDNDFDGDENYVFISYSHKDSEAVYRTVLSWIREGYNIFIDLNFKNNTSDKNWIDLMRKRVRSNSCALAVAFRSAHYYWSLAALVELLTMRSKTTRNSRKAAANPILPLDVIVINGDSKCKEIQESEDFKKIYKKTYQSRRDSNPGPFLNNNQKEKELLKDGLESLSLQLNQLGEEEETTADSLYNELQEGYDDNDGSYRDYYPVIERMFRLFFKGFDLNGNTKNLEGCTDSEKTVFSNLKVYQRRIAVSEKIEIKSDAQPAKAVEQTTKTVEQAKAPAAKAPAAKAQVGQPAQTVKGINFGGNEIGFTLYETKYRENQSDMMLRVFREVLEKHPEVLPDIIDKSGMSCLSKTDYTKPSNRNEEMKSYFRQCDYYDINGGVCVGTAYGLDAKLYTIAKLLSYCGEELSTLTFEEEKSNDVLARNYNKGLSMVGAGNKQQASAPKQETARKSEGKQDSTEAATYKFDNKSMNAYAREEKDGTIILLKGSLVKKKTADSCPSGYATRREEELKNGALADDGEYYVLTRDLSFTSKSGAGAFVSGLSTNGQIAWKKIEEV